MLEWLLPALVVLAILFLLVYRTAYKRGYERGIAGTIRMKAVLDQAGLRMPEDLPRRLKDQDNDITQGTGSWTGQRHDPHTMRPPGVITRFDETTSDQAIKKEDYPDAIGPRPPLHIRRRLEDERKPRDLD